MDSKVDSTDVNEKMDAGNDNEPKFHNLLTTASKSPLTLDKSMADQTGMFTEKYVMNCSYLERHTFFSCLTESLAEATTRSGQISTEDTELSSADISVNVFQNKTIGKWLYEYVWMDISS